MCSYTSGDKVSYPKTQRLRILKGPEL